jgi:HPr kinase/phosphorylase
MITRLSSKTMIDNLSSLTVKDIYQPEHLTRCFISKVKPQRPSLALAGYFGHIEDKRVVLFGQTEINFIKSLPLGHTLPYLKILLERSLSPLVISCALDIPEDMKYAVRVASLPIIVFNEDSEQVYEDIYNYLSYALAEEVSLHGVCVEIFGLGVILTGRSGIGKSECALELVKKGHRLVADDIVFLRKRNSYLVATCDDILKNMMELRGVGVVDVAKLFGLTAVRTRKKVDLFIRLVDYSDWEAAGNARRIDAPYGTKEMMGVKIPEAVCPVSKGRSISEVVELVAKNQLLKIIGYDTTAEFLNAVAEKTAQNLKNV